MLGMENVYCLTSFLKYVIQTAMFINKSFIIEERFYFRWQ